MKDSKQQLNILVVDADTVYSTAIFNAFKQVPIVRSVKYSRDVKEARSILSEGYINSIAIDIFTIGVGEGIDLILYIRETFPSLPICLLGVNYTLANMPNVTKEMQLRLRHYYKLNKELPPDLFLKNAEITAHKLLSYLLASAAKIRLNGLREQLLRNDTDSVKIATDVKQDIEDAIDVAQEAIDAQKRQNEWAAGIVPGFEEKDVQALVNHTLDKASKSLDISTKINLGILIFGGILIAASFTVACLTNRWESIAFGGFGLAGVITSLITNPLKSIGFASRRIVQIQIAYIGFLNQIAIINEYTSDTPDAAITKSTRLQEAIQNIQETLEKYFD